MRKLLATILFSFLMCGIANAKKIHDANENGILMTECVFAKGKCYRIAENHCAQYKKFYIHVWNHQAEKPYTVRMYCVNENLQFFYEPVLKKQLKVQKTNFDPNSPWAINKKNNSNSVSSSGTGDKIAQSKKICKELGFKTNSEKFADCALKMMALQFETGNKVSNSDGSSTQKIVVQQQDNFDIGDFFFGLQKIVDDNYRSTNNSNQGTACRIVPKHWGADMVCR